MKINNVLNIFLIFGIYYSMLVINADWQTVAYGDCPSLFLIEPLH